MAFKLASGYSRLTLNKNIADLEREGWDRDAAIVMSYNSARKSYFKAHPHGFLPIELAYPKTKRNAKDYAFNGAPIRKNVPGSNPVRELDIKPAERKRIKREVSDAFSKNGKGLRDAARLYADFTGHEDVKIGKIKVPHMPKEVLAIGKCDGILYSTVRDGIAEKYIHKFKASSRPLLTASPDGKQLYLLGGAYDFTERGIVDKS